jgi:hypothetical protein
MAIDAKFSSLAENRVIVKPNHLFDNHLNHLV